MVGFIAIFLGTRKFSGLTRSPLSQGHLSHKVTSLTRSALSQGHLSHKVSSLTRSALSQGHLSHKVTSLTRSPLLQGPLSHKVTSLTRSPLLQGPLSHKVTSPTRSALSQGHLSHKVTFPSIKSPLSLTIMLGSSHPPLRRGASHTHSLPGPGCRTHSLPGFGYSALLLQYLVLLLVLSASILCDVISLPEAGDVGELRYYLNTCRPRAVFIFTCHHILLTFIVPGPYVYICCVILTPVFLGSCIYFCFVI